MRALVSFTNLSISTGVNGNSPVYGSTVASTFGQVCWTSRLRIFLVASRNLKGRSTDLPNNVIGITQ